MKFNASQSRTSLDENDIVTAIVSILAPGYSRRNWLPFMKKYDDDEYIWW